MCGAAGSISPVFPASIDHGCHVVSTPFVRLYVSLVQNAAAFRYQH
jgi:hypothetical protein